MAVTELLEQLQQGDGPALNKAVSFVYAELRQIASRLLDREKSGHVLQPTALVHEVYAKLHGASLPVQDRKHFLAVCARAMRQILVDEARKHRRSPAHGSVTLMETRIGGGEIQNMDVTKIDSLLSRLEEYDERKCRLAELVYFAGMTQKEAAEVLGLSERTIRRELTITRAWILAELEGG